MGQHKNSSKRNMPVIASVVFLHGQDSSKPGFTLVEILIGFLVVGMLLLPVFTSISHAVRETERYYTEAFAITHAKGVMDTFMFQIPWRCLHEGNPCKLWDPKGIVDKFLEFSVQKLFDNDKEVDKKFSYYADGRLVDPKGFIYRIRVKCVDLPGVTFSADAKQIFTTDKLVQKDADQKYNLMKKIIVEIRWSLVKNEDPLFSQNPKKLFLVAIKSDTER